MTSHSLVVGLGASAGGIRALRTFLERVSPGSGHAYVVVLHLSPDHDSRLADVLRVSSPIPVDEVHESVRVESDHVYVIPPNRSLSIRDGVLELAEVTRIEERRAPIDIFFRTLADHVGARAACVVLSGTGADGSMGLKRVKEHGGICLAQDPGEAEYADMPRSAIATGFVDHVVGAASMAPLLEAYARGLQTVRVPEEPADGSDAEASALRDVFTLLRTATGHDFSNYKRSTVSRRIARRLAVLQLPDVTSYAAYLDAHGGEANALLKDLLISVTNFFRDREAFEALERTVVPRLFAGKGEEDTVRVWIAGCATGEEAYSLAMLLAEHTSSLIGAPSIQVFATDIDESAIAMAREGCYTINDAADVSPERLARFFSKEGGEYRVRKELREIVLFAPHNLIKDPPFSHLDLVSCRNLLIYMNRIAQQRILDLVHFALNPGGYLLIGPSESVDGATHLFMPVEKETHLFQSRVVTSRRVIAVPELLPARRGVRVADGGPAARARDRLSYADVHQRLLEQYAPPSLVVNEQHEIVHLSDRVGEYLQMPGGEPSHGLLASVHPDLRLELSTALYQASQLRSAVETRSIPTRIGSRATTVRLIVRPVLRESEPERGFFLVVFDEIAADAAPRESPVPADDPARQLEEELFRLQAQLRIATEQYETQAEELKASNEELQAMNEELRSAAEELETSKEELQSVNEELTTVNQELKIKVEEQAQAANDISNLINSTDIGTVFLDRGLHIKLFTPPARDIFRLIAADRGRPLSDISSLLVEGDLRADVERVRDRLDRVEREVQTRDGRWHLMRMLPYRTSEDRIEGVIITFVDITARRKAEERLQQSVESLEVRVRERTRELESANALLDLQLRERQAAEDRVRRLMHRLITVQEDERRRVARDLHDHLGQQMTGLRLEIEALATGDPDEVGLRTRIEAVQRQVDRLDRDLDFLIWQLRPAVLEGLALRDALARYVGEWTANYGTPAEFQASGVGDERLDPQVETSMYRVLQEALNNVQKHAQATLVGVILERRGDDLVLVIEDNGRGFDAAAFEGAPHDGHQMGVIGMRERAALAGGSVDIETAIGHGTTVFMRVPGGSVPGHG